MPQRDASRRLSWPCWLTDSGRLNHKVVTHPASSLAEDRESSPAETSILTTMLRRKHQDSVHPDDRSLSRSVDQIKSLHFGKRPTARPVRRINKQNTKKKTQKCIDKIIVHPHDCWPGGSYLREPMRSELTSLTYLTAY